MADSTTDSITVPIKVTQSEQSAPPTLAEPASGPVAEMSGALTSADKSEVSSAAVKDVSPSTNDATKVNGASNSAIDSATEKPAEPSDQPAPEAATPTEDTDMADASAADAASAPDASSAATEKKTPNGKRKSVGGVPEHKGKKLNKKKSMPKITHLDAEPGDYYFARLKSYPPWPSIICDEDMLPTSLLTTRPVTTKKADGTYNEAYADGGKKVVDRTYPIMFLYTNEFAWIPNTDLTPLEPNECQDVQQKSKTKALVAAYEVAAEGHDLAYFKDMLQDHANAMKEEEERKEAREAEKAAKDAAKSDKKKRKSEVKAAANDEDVDMADADAEPKKSSKKRKKEADAEDEEPEKPAKTPKTTKIKLTTNKTPATTEKKAKEPKSAKPKSEKKKSKAAAADAPAETVEEPEPKPLDPVEERKAREKEVLFLRHKLQKGFLSRDQAPREDEMPQMSNYIKKLEGYPDLEVSIIRATKINKVLKALVKLNTIPRDEEFLFKKRSVELLGKWNKMLGAEPTDVESGDKENAKSKDSPATNGVHEEKSSDEKPVDVKTDEAKDDVPPPVENTDKPAETIEKIAAEVPADAGAKASVTDSVSGDANASAAEDKKTEPAVVDRAPASADAAAVAQEVVKANE